MSKIIGVTVGTPTSPKKIEEELKPVLYTAQTLTPEQQAQARANIGVVPGAETFDTQKEVVVGKNLLNLNAPMPDPDDPYSGGFVRDYRFDDSHNIIYDSAQCITDYIPVKPGMALVFSSGYAQPMGGMIARRIFGYDEDKNLIRLLASSVNGIGATLIGDAVYVRMQFEKRYADADGQVEYSNTSTGRTEYEPYTETVTVTGYALKEACLPPKVVDSALAIDKARFDKSFNYIAYSAVSGVGDANSAGHFLSCAKKAFTSLKGDVRITSDGKLIMCHDAGFTIDSNGKIASFDSANYTPIRDMTEAECLALQHARYGGRVCNFDYFIRICKKYGKIAFVTIRDEYMSEVVPEMMYVLRKYAMAKQCIVNSFTYSSLEAVRKADASIMLSQVMNYQSGVDKAAINRAVALGNCMISGFDFSGSTTADDVASKIDTSVINYAVEKDIRVYQAQVSSMEVADKLLEYGITGAQMLVEPSFE